ncbi:8978_t:CDS:2 [Acaulospora morrowiae]|uniref:8978_t:CDS:1 n=1 Tax=Acaulospora morrowiae TaxID=94023 RepID=A0A9N8V0Q8_9GLOM|nr:8978_t:CDS:2 [Acaulospora morrowiae]
MSANVIYYSVFDKSFEFAINHWDERDFDPRISIDPTYFYEIPEVTINNVEFLSKEMFGNFMEIDLLNDLKKINDYSAKLGVLIKDGLFFASNTLSYFSENHNEFVKGWKNDLDSRGKIKNLTDPYLNYIDKSIESCEIFADQFSELHEVRDRAIKKLEESLQKIEKKMEKNIYEQILEKKNKVDEWFQKSKESFHITNYKKKADKENDSLIELNEKGYKNLIMDRLFVELECIKNTLEILKSKGVLDFWKRITVEFQLNRELMEENVIHGELYVKEYAIDHTIDNLAKIGYIIDTFCQNWIHC